MIRYRSNQKAAAEKCHRSEERTFLPEKGRSRMKEKRERQDDWRRAHYREAGINDKLIINLRDLSHVMRSLYEGKGSQKRVLIILHEEGGHITQRELTRRLEIKPGSASEVIAKLEGAGYIRRTPDETDRRTVEIELTEEGRKAAQEARQQRIRRHEEMFSCLSEEEKNTLLSLLETVRADWKERYQDGPRCHGGE